MLQVNKSTNENYEALFMHFLQKPSTKGLPDNWILLGSHSTVKIFKSKQFPHNVRKVNSALVRSNKGGHHKDLIGNIPNYGTVWYMKQESCIALGRPSFKKCLDILEKNYIPHCTLISSDAKQTEAIYGKDMAVIKGKSTQTKGTHKGNVQVLSVPESIMQKYQEIALYVKSEDLFYGLQLVINLYHSWGLKYQL